jgi:hypothetical protein
MLHVCSFEVVGVTKRRRRRPPLNRSHELVLRLLCLRSKTDGDQSGDVTSSNDLDVVVYKLQVRLHLGS